MSGKYEDGAVGLKLGVEYKQGADEEIPKYPALFSQKLDECSEFFTGVEYTGYKLTDVNTSVQTQDTVDAEGNPIPGQNVQVSGKLVEFEMIVYLNGGKDAELKDPDDALTNSDTETAETTEGGNQ